MQKAKQYNIADSNIANLGSDLEKKVKLEAAQHEDAWKGAGTVPGTQIWRVEKFKIIPVAKENYGTFYSGDSYIVLHTYKPDPKNEKLAWDAHFWLGKFTTQDEAGTAAYKTVELDDFLGGAPVQYREVQGYESNRFMSYFPKGVQLLDGGVETGFKQVKAGEYRTRLLHFKGTKKNVRVLEVELSHKSLNSGDVFVVDKGTELIQWNGSKAGIFEKSKGAEFLQSVESDRNGKAQGRVLDEGHEDDAFWAAIGGKGAVSSAEAGGSDADHSQKGQKALYKLSDASGKLEFTEVAKGDSFKKSQLDSNDVFIVDAGDEVVAWVGKSASAGEKKKALHFAQDYLTTQKKNIATPISRVLEGGENSVFNGYFS
jgi:gelsolin